MAKYDGHSTQSGPTENGPVDFSTTTVHFRRHFFCLLLFEHNEMTSDNDPIVITFIQINI